MPKIQPPDRFRRALDHGTARPCSARGFLKIEEAVRVAFGSASVPGGLSEEGKSARITQTRELLQSSIRPLHCLGGSEGEARFGCFVCPWAASHEARFVCFVSSHTKQSHAPSVPEWAQGVSERRSRFSRLHHARTAGIAARVAGHEARLVSFVSGHTKQSRVPSVGFG